MRADLPPKPSRQILTVSVEDYYHTRAFEGVVRPKHWERFESHLEDNLRQVLDLLARYNVIATFFVLGWIAERRPELVRRISEDGHEIASRGYWPRGVAGAVPQEFRENLHRASESLEAAGANRIIGFRAPRWLDRDDLWVLDILAEEGYAYDSSINPVMRRFATDLRRHTVHRHRHSLGSLSLWEVPIPTCSVAGFRIAISGGNYVRQLPHWLLRRAAARWIRERESPLVFYFMPWEIDWNLPRIAGLSRLDRIRQYRNLAKTRWVLEDYLQRYEFQPIGDYLGLPWRLQPRGLGPPEPVPALRTGSEPLPGAEPVTLVIPVFNEEQSIAYLKRTLRDLRARLRERYRVHVVLVDDGSTDHTWSRLSQHFPGEPDCRLIRHERNQGVAAAILTGVRGAPTEIVCSMDCDCSYDPREFETMIPAIERADLVTTSPYHPDGCVVNVPPWRLFLSKTLSGMYSLLVGKQIHTFTSCFRVYRKSAIEGIEIENGGFLGVAEILIRLKLAGGRVEEHPATLESRLLGESKMKIVRTIGSHLGLLRRLALRRWRRRSAAAR